ncbi:MAG TPA: hypothetical protein VFO07_00845 [Roseiflexaceae bacterium]|nr:hypothetical protein [Roseiflexaceae bacterium]
MERLYQAFFRRRPVRQVRTDSHLELLNPDESAYIQRVHRRAMLMAALLDVIAYFLYYLPIYYAPRFFPIKPLPLPLAGPIPLRWGEIVWALVLTAAEIYALVLLNIAGVHEIGVGTGYLTPETKPHRTSEAIRISLAYKPRVASRYGIDPYQGTNRWMLFLFLTVARFKGWIGNKLIQYSLANLLGRFALHVVIDFAGMPLYMALNAWATNTVLREARVIIMGQAIIESLVRSLPLSQLPADGQIMLYDTLQYIAISKRDYHQNHDMLTERLMQRFDIPIEKYHYVSANYLELLSQRHGVTGRLCRLVLVLGYILDGRVSRRERKQIERLNRLGILDERYDDVQRFCTDFVSGAGVERLIQHYLGAGNRDVKSLELERGLQP